jgi:uncharacterized protein (DUF488 family)
MTGKPLYLIGYEKAGLADFLTTLARAGIATVVDVRDLPLSRRAGFSKRQLQASVETAGMRYVHLRGHAANKARQWERFWRIVDDRLATSEAELALEILAAMAAAAPTCLLCYEADWHICHRRRVGEILSARHGFAIQPLSVDGAGVVERS